MNISQKVYFANPRCNRPMLGRGLIVGRSRQISPDSIYSWCTAYDARHVGLDTPSAGYYCGNNGEKWKRVGKNGAMFLGEYTHNIDPKGRLAIPVKFRGALADGAVVTRALDGCLTVYPRKEWEILATKIAALPLTDPHARAFARFMLSGASDVETDKQGRIVLPAYLRQYAGLGAQAVVAGLYNRVEIWESGRWQKANETGGADSSNIAAHLTELGI